MAQIQFMFMYEQHEFKTVGRTNLTPNVCMYVPTTKTCMYDNEPLTLVNGVCKHMVSRPKVFKDNSTSANTTSKTPVKETEAFGYLGTLVSSHRRLLINFATKRQFLRF